MDRFPISFFTATGQLTTDHVKGYPCVDIKLAVLDNQGKMGPSQTVRALVDTGADLVYATPHLLDRLHASPIGTVGNVNGGAGAQLWGIWLRPTSTLGIPVVAVDRDFPAEGPVPYELALGRFALQHFQLSLHLGRPEKCHLELLSDAPEAISVPTILRPDLSAS